MMGHAVFIMSTVVSATISTQTVPFGAAALSFTQEAESSVHQSCRRSSTRRNKQRALTRFLPGGDTN